MLQSLLSAIGVYKVYRRWLQMQIESEEKPEHIGIILDGNRRWAFARDMIPWHGHREGAEKVKKFLDWCIDLGIKTVTLYAFSTENFQRQRKEVDEIMKLTEEHLEEILGSEVIHESRVCVRAIGRINQLPRRVQQLIHKVEESTMDYDQFYLNLALAYGGRAEIVDAAKKIVSKVQRGEMRPDDIDEGVFEEHLYTSYLPKQDPDLIIRTSGEARLSGFLLWQSAYSELFFVDVYWPEFREIDLLRAIRSFQQRHRRYGI
ncbi:MAG: polyprenyl diphosphate synthase [Candidatus Bathyarchaeota archaeon]|nr:polyprenyl diphosphate synthase [Candidatus Bathyarchaeota archaeon]